MSHVLLQTGDVPGSALTVTWVEVAAGGRQRAHRDAPEQVFMILEALGRMAVGSDVRELKAGQLVRIPSGVAHAIENVSRGSLRYVSASSPAFRVTDVYDRGELAPDR